MSVWTEFLQNKKFEIKDDYGIFLHEFRTPMFFSTEDDLMTYISDTDLKEILYIKFKEDKNFKLFGSEKKHQEIINSTEKKKFKNSFLWFIVILIGSLVYHYFVKEIDFKELNYSSLLEEFSQLPKCFLNIEILLMSVPKNIKNLLKILFLAFGYKNLIQNFLHI